MITNYSDSLNKLGEFFSDSLSELNIPELIYIDTNAGVTDLNGLVIDNDNLKHIVFKNLEPQPYYLVNKNLETINLESLKRIEFGNNSILNDNFATRFLHDTKLRTLELPNFLGVVSTGFALGGNDINYEEFASRASFWNNYWLEDVSLGNENLLPTTTVFNGFWFNNNYSLTSLRLNYPYVITLTKGTVGFRNTPILAGNGYIYVPDNLVDAYRTNGEWSQLGTKILGLSQYANKRAQIADTLSNISWSEIIDDCNSSDSSRTERYQIGDTKTVTINGIPIQMVIVGKNHDTLAGSSNLAKISWLGRTIAMFEPVSTAETYSNDKPRQYGNATNFHNYLSNIFSNIDGEDETDDQYSLKKPTGIKTVDKPSSGLDNVGGKYYYTSEEKIWVPSAYEIGLDSASGSLRTYDYFSENPANYTIGATTLTRFDNTPIAIALRDITNNSSSYLDIAIAQTGSNSAPMGVASGSSQRPFVVFGFCT